MFRATMCSSSGGQLYEYNIWYNHSVLVAVRYAGQDGSSILTCIQDGQEEEIVRQIGYLPDLYDGVRCDKY
jgi:hypothetical protein